MWLDRKVSLYKNSLDVIGKPRTIRQVLLTDFARDISTIIELKKLNPEAPDYKDSKKALKAKLQGWTPAACLQSREKDNTIITSLTGLMQLDWDAEQLKDYHLPEVMEAVFSLPFVAFCGLSCSGTGFFALIEIAEPDRLEDYALHCFDVFAEYALTPDTGKGRSAKDLRFVSYDADMLIRMYPVPLKIEKFRKKKVQEVGPAKTYFTNGNHTQSRVETMINQITQSGTDITQGYENWLSIGFALAREFAESGRQYFHDVSRYNLGYNVKKCDEQFTHCLRSKRLSGYSINTFFHICKSAGILANAQAVC